MPANGWCSTIWSTTSNAGPLYRACTSDGERYSFIGTIGGKSGLGAFTPPGCAMARPPAASTPSIAIAKQMSFFISILEYE